MFKYKVTFSNGLNGVKFESRHHISMMQAMPIAGSSYVTFKDAGITLDLAQVKEMEINGKKYKLKAYVV